MARFFIPPLADDSLPPEQAYRELRDQAEACTGALTRERRIELVECRQRGRDCLLQVGEPDVATGRMVAAIMQVGRSTFTVHHVGEHPGESPDPVVLQQSEVYSITDFQ